MMLNSCTPVDSRIRRIHHPVLHCLAWCHISPHVPAENGSVGMIDWFSQLPVDWDPPWPLSRVEMRRAYNLEHWKWWLRAEEPNPPIGGKSLPVGTIRLRWLGLVCFVLFCLGVIILRCRRLPKSGRGIAGNLSIDLNHFRSCNRKMKRSHHQLVLCSCSSILQCVFEWDSRNIAFHSKPWPD